MPSCKQKCCWEFRYFTGQKVAFPSLSRNYSNVFLSHCPFLFLLVFPFASWEHKARSLLPLTQDAWVAETATDCKGMASGFCNGVSLVPSISFSGNCEGGGQDGLLSPLRRMMDGKRNLSSWFHEEFEECM